MWQALILLAGALGEAAPLTPETFQEKQTVSVPAPQPLDTPTKGTPAGAPSLTWDGFLPHFRRAVRLINQDEFTEADCERLTQLGQHLVKELDNSIKKRPTATKSRLIGDLRECLNEMPHAETMLSHKLAELEKTPALYDARSPLIREAIAAAEDTIGGLIELLGKYYPETLTGSIRTANGPLAVSELVLKYLPGFHDLNKKIRSEQAPPAPATTEPTQPGSPTLDTAPPAALTVADLCRDGFTPDDVLALAREVGLADEAGRFCLWSRKPGTKPRKLGAVVGFCKALGGDAKGVTAPPLAGTIPERVRAVGVLLDVEIRTAKTGTGVAEKYRKATERALARRKPTH